ncbi:MAG: hypothetical protein ACOYOK_14505 [Pseudobdellovibrionaceae bacterium]
MYHDFSYHILSARSAFHPEETYFRNSIYQGWYSLWSKVYAEANSGYELASDEFARQDLATAILYKGQVAAVHLYSFFHLDSESDTRTKYFHFFSDNYLNQLRSKNVNTVMSMEFLTVLPEFRKSKIGFSLGSVIAQMGSYIFSEVNVDAIIAPARNDIGVNQMAYDLGFSCIEKETEQRGFVCDMIACFQGRQKKSSLSDVSSIADFLWNHKTVYPSAGKLITPEYPQPLELAA